MSVASSHDPLLVRDGTSADANTTVAAGSSPTGDEPGDRASDSSGEFVVPSYPGWGPIGPVLSHAKAEEWRFVLQAVRIPSWSCVGSNGLPYLMVPLAARARAARELGEYESELRERREVKHVRDVPLHASSWWAAGVSMLLMAFFLVTGPLSSRSVWFQHGIADTNQILAGALEQSVTALTLHTDAAHVLGNAVVGGLFLSAVHRRFGAGFGTFIVVTAGAAGNLMNALWHGVDHRSLGASTAVMAALGVLTVAQFVRNQRERPRLKTIVAWAPIAGGLALLGAFGASPQSDLYAHGFGFLAGVVLGLPAAFAFRSRSTPLPAWARIGFGLTTAAIVAGSWAVAFRAPPA